LDNKDIRAGGIVLIFTGFDKKFRENEYYEKYPEISLDFAQKLIDLKVKLVGMDIPSPDRSPFKVHKLLLAKEILIIENLTNLEKLVSVPKFEIIALPAKLETEAGFVRVIAKI